MADRRRRTGGCAQRAHEEEGQDEMTVGLPVEVPAAPTQRFDLLTVLERLQARVRSAEDRAASLEQALATNRQIGIAIGILMCQRRLTEDQAIALLEKGVALNPNKWDYYHDIGFIYYWNLHDYKNAADWFSRGGNLPGAPFWLRTYAAVMLTRGGDRQASRVMWTQIGQNEESDWLKRM